MSGNCQEKSCFLEKCQDCQEIVSFFPNTKILYLYFMSLKVKDPCCWYVIFVHLAHPEMQFPKIFACGGLFVCLYVKRFAVAGGLTNPENPENPETGMWPQKPWPWEQPFFLSYDPEIIPHSGAFWSSKTQNFLQPWWKCSQIIIRNHSFWSISEQ